MRRSAPGISESMPTIQNGVIATSSAANPLGIVCSAQTRPPLPNPSSRMPSTASRPHARGGGIVSPRALSTATSSAPART